MRAIVVVLFLFVTACGGETSTQPDQDGSIRLPDVPVAWTVVSDTSLLFPSSPSLPDVKLVRHSTKALGVSGGATLTVACQYSFGGASNAAPTTAITIERASGFFPLEPFPLILTRWAPHDQSNNPALVWQVPTAVPWTAFLVELSKAAFRQAIQSKTALNVYWFGAVAGSRTDLIFDVRGLSDAVATIEARCVR